MDCLQQFRRETNKSDRGMMNDRARQHTRWLFRGLRLFATDEERLDR